MTARRFVKRIPVTTRAGMASSNASIDGSSTRKKAGEREAYFAWIEYVQSVAECVDMEEKVRSAVAKTEARKREYVCQIAEALKEERQLQARIAYYKEFRVNKDDMVKMNTQGDIGLLRDDLAQQSKQHMDADAMAIRGTELVDKEKLGTSLLAMAAKGGPLERLAIVDACKAQGKLAQMVLVGGQELSRISSLKEKIADKLEALEFLKVARDVCQDETLDSQYDTALDLESLNLSP